MKAMELEVQKASLARKILMTNDETMILRAMELFKMTYPQKKYPKREIGFLKGKANVVFADDWSMSPEELGMV